MTPTPATPGSAQSDVSLLRVPAGFNSFNRRRLVMPVPMMASQEQDERFEKEFLKGGGAGGGQSSTILPFENFGEESTTESGSQNKSTSSLSASATAVAPIVGENPFGGDDDGGFGDDYAPADEIDEENPFLTKTRTTAPKKKYTQKRSTRLHKSKSFTTKASLYCYCYYYFNADI